MSAHHGEELKMTETLMGTTTKIWLFGRVVEDISVDDPSAGKSKSNKAQFIRAYGFSFGGAYYNIMRPTLFQVRGNGVDPKTVDQPGPDPDDEGHYKTLRAWECDQSDSTVRLDVDSGRFEQVLLGMAADGSFAQAGGHGGHTSGALVSGALVSGNRVSGALVSGALVSGALVSGARGKKD